MAQFVDSEFLPAPPPYREAPTPPPPIDGAYLRLVLGRSRLRAIQVLRNACHS